MKSFIALYTMPWIVLKQSVVTLYDRIELIPVPMSLRILVQWCEHDGKDGLDVVADQITEVFVVPKVQCTLRHLRQGQPAQERVEVGLT